MLLKLKNIDERIRTFRSLKLITIMVLALLGISLAFLPLIRLYEFYISDCGGAKCSSIGEAIFLGCFIAPFIETLIFQALVFFILSKIKFFKENKIFIVIVSAFLFSLAHNYSYIYMLNIFFHGLILEYSYLICYEKKDGFPIFTVMIIHSLYNALSIIL